MSLSAPAADRRSVDVTEELEESFYEYSSSVLTSRALPDARDGLTPVRRRILYAMMRAGTTSAKPYRKSVASVSDTMKSYHPHGDASIYGSLAKMAQPFSLNVPLVDGHGNFGAPDHPPAAQRYTEARLARAAEMLLAGIDEDCVDFVPNFDSSTNEPRVLPAAWPALLINGSQGVAVGVTTSIPPHNPREAIEAALYRLSHPRCRLSSVMKVMPGPDYPTGARLMAHRSSLVDLYGTGAGSVTLRSTVRVSVSEGSLQQVLDFVDIPFSTSPEKIVLAVQKASAEDGPLGPLVESVEDLSDRRHGMLLRVTLRSGVPAPEALESLYRHSPLETVEHYRMAVLEGGRLHTEMGLLGLLDCYLAHRLEVVRRRSEFRRDRARSRLERVEALRKAHSLMDEVIEACRSTAPRSRLVGALAALLGVSRDHADAVADLPLRSIGRLDAKELDRQAAALRKEIESLGRLLSDESRLRAAVAKELRAALGEFDGRDRRTEMHDSEEDTAVASLSELRSRSYDACVLDDGRVAPFVPDGAEAVSAASASEQGAVCAVLADGTGVRVDCSVLRASSEPVSLGAPAIAVVPDGSRVLLASSGLKAKHVDLSSAVPRYYAAGQPVSLMALADGDVLVSAEPSADDAASVAAVASDGRVLAVQASSIPQQGLSAAGVSLMAPREGRRLLAAGLGPSVVVPVSARGAAVCSVPAESLPRASRGTVGRPPSAVPGWPSGPAAAYCGSRRAKWMARRRAFCLRGL